HRLQPAPTLFPYTTLFRSEDREGPDGQQVRGEQENEQRLLPARAAAVKRHGPDHHRKAASTRRKSAGSGLSARTGAPVSGWTKEDRKSTRLNSSHEWISYA